MSNPLMQKSFEELRNGVVLAELGGYGDGSYCAKHGKGAALVMLGTYIVDAGDSVPYPSHFVFKPDRQCYFPYLQEHIGIARSSGARVGISVISINVSDTVDFLKAAQDAGVDYASLCAHSAMNMFTSVGLGSALCRRENRAQLKEWAKAILKAVQLPVIFKIGFQPDIIGAVNVITSAGIPIVHLNVGNTESGSKSLAILGELKSKCPFLIGGGGIRNIEGAKRVLKAGADAVAIGTAAMKDPNFCGQIQNLLRK